MSSYNSKKPRTLNEAYRTMIKTVRAEALGESRQRLFAIRQAVKHGDWPKDTTMRDHLKKAGWKRVAEELWTTVG